jgi:hypothetical protein
MAVLSLPVTTQRIGYKDIAVTAQACIEQKRLVVWTLGLGLMPCLDKQFNLQFIT